MKPRHRHVSREGRAGLCDVHSWSLLFQLCCLAIPGDEVALLGSLSRLGLDPSHLLDILLSHIQPINDWEASGKYNMLGKR